MSDLQTYSTNDLQVINNEFDLLEHYLVKVC